MGSVTYPTLEHVAMDARPYPSELLEGCETGLVLFAAAYLGHNDAIHFAEAELQTTCVDVDGERLAAMRALYPDDWTFLAEDAWTYAERRAVDGFQYDAVSVDTFTGEAEARSMKSLELWTSLARKVVTVTVTAEHVTRHGIALPEGWGMSLRLRAPGVYWLVLTRLA